MRISGWGKAMQGILFVAGCCESGKKLRAEGRIFCTRIQDYIIEMIGSYAPNMGKQ